MIRIERSTLLHKQATHYVLSCVVCGNEVCRAHHSECPCRPYARTPDDGPVCSYECWERCTLLGIRAS